MNIRFPIFNNFLNLEYEITWRDLLSITLFIFILWFSVLLLKDMNIPLNHIQSHPMNLAPHNIPYYMLRSTFRMFVAYFASLLFTLLVGYIAYKNKKVGAFIIPIIDILQSVPVLGFLSITVTGFMAIFPHNLLGVELASLFAIFTGQAWNMTLGFYHSLITIPNDLKEASTVYKLNPWQRFSRLELPSSAISIVWNSMMSFGGGWFFVVQSEMITVLNKNIKLPGIGSYMGMALESGDKKAALYAVCAMVATIIFIDQFFWKPITVWSQKFKNEQVDSADSLTSTFYNVLSKSKLVNLFFDQILKFIDFLADLFFRISFFNDFFKEKEKETNKKAFFTLLPLFVFYIFITYFILKAVISIHDKFNLKDYAHVFYLGTITMLRVLIMIIISTLIWTPIGVWVGLRPKLSKIVRPLAQVGASFPINMTFPVLVGFFISQKISINWGSVLLLSLGSQWYILFNIIAGASSIPSDMKESAKIFKLKGVNLWKKMIIPAIFPFWVTGACTAAGGAWNASIVAEYANFGNQKLIATGLGSYITQVTNDGNWNGIFLSIAMMSLFVVVINRFVWRRLYQLSEKKFHLD